MNADPSVPARSTPRGSWTVRDALFVTLLACLSGVVLAKDISVGGFRYGDASAHAMDGVLIRDWVVAGPEAWRRPMDFALAQYGHYPTLGIGRHYPPGFALVEAAFFGVLGISVVAARLCVVFFGVLVAVGTYVFVRRLTDRVTALLAGLILVTMPETTLWGRQVMLEVPTMAALVWGAVALLWYLDRPGWGRLTIAWAACLSAVLFKQPAIFLVGAASVTLVLGALRGRLPIRHAVCSVIVAGVAGLGVVLSLGPAGAALLRGLESQGYWTWDAMTFYLRLIPKQAGWGICVAGVIGLLLSRRRFGAAWPLLPAWFLVCTIMLTSADFKNPRFYYIALFPFAVCAAVTAKTAISLIRQSRWRAVPLAALCTWLVIGGLSAPVPYRPDYGPIVAAHTAQIDRRVVLFSGLRDGDFVFAVRQHLPWRQTAVVRGSKLLYTCDARTDLNFASYVSNAADVADLMETVSPAYVFVERENKLDLSEDALLRDYLARSERYRCANSYSLQAGEVPGPLDVTLDVYELAPGAVRRVDHLDIPIPRIGRTVRLDLDQWS